MHCEDNGAGSGAFPQSRFRGICCRHKKKKKNAQHVFVFLFPWEAVRTSLLPLHAFPRRVVCQRLASSTTPSKSRSNMKDPRFSLWLLLETCTFCFNFLTYLQNHVYFFSFMKIDTSAHSSSYQTIPINFERDQETAACHRHLPTSIVIRRPLVRQ